MNFLAEKGISLPRAPLPPPRTTRAAAAAPAVPAPLRITICFQSQLILRPIFICLVILLVNVTGSKILDSIFRGCKIICRVLFFVMVFGIMCCCFVFFIVNWHWHLQTLYICIAYGYYSYDCDYYSLTTL